MNFVVMLLGLAVSLISPGKRGRRTRRKSDHRRFYGQGFMADEIDALESILDSEYLQRSRRRKR